MKTTTLSVRVDDDDAVFLASLDLGDARTPSEKLRALLQAERKRNQGIRDPVDAADVFRDLLQPARRRVRRFENEAGIRSDFLAKFFDRLSEMAGVAAAGPGKTTKGGKAKDTAQTMEAFESDLLDEVFLFILESIELGLTQRNRCYDSSGIEKRLGPVLEILDLINISKERRRGDTND